MDNQKIKNLLAEWSAIQRDDFDSLFADDQKHYLSYISVDPSHQNKGIAKALIQHWFGHILNRELGECGCSGYTKKGFEYLKPILETLPFPIQKRNLEF